MLRASFLLSALALFVTPVAAATPVGLDPIVTITPRAVGIENAGDGSGRLFLVQQPGVISIWDGTQLLEEPFLQIAERVFSGSSEQGLLGLAFHPEYEANGTFFVHYTNLDGNTAISSFQVTADANVADPESEIPVLVVEQPFSNHNGGKITFGPDGLFYIGLGDGGSSGDPQGRGQDLDTLLGKILRIDVDGDDFPSDDSANYAVPADNPFVGIDGRDEIWVYGLRNPWRFSFDRDTGDLFIGDVGQNLVEEIDFQAAASAGGENFGWNRMEGSQCFEPPTDCNDGTLVLPILEYLHFDPNFSGCSVTGGHRYRGSRNPLLDGVYLYGDYCLGKIWAGIEQENGTWIAPAPLVTDLAIASFGEDEEGEIYLADHNTNTIYRLHDTRPFCDLELDAQGYAVGETITLETLRLVNRGGGDVAARAQLGVVPPGGIFRAVLERAVTLSSDSDRDLGPRALFDVAPGTPAGTYEVVCRLLDDAGEEIASDAQGFEIL